MTALQRVCRMSDGKALSLDPSRRCILEDGTRATLADAKFGEMVRILRRERGQTVEQDVIVTRPSR